MTCVCTIHTSPGNTKKVVLKQKQNCIIHPQMATHSCYCFRAVFDNIYIELYGSFKEKPNFCNKAINYGALVNTQVVARNLVCNLVYIPKFHRIIKEMRYI